MRRKNLFGKPIRRLKIFPILVVFTVLIAIGFFSMRFWFENRIDDLEQTRFDLELSVRSFQLPVLEPIDTSLEQLQVILPVNTTTEDVRVDVAVLVDRSSLQLDGFNSTVRATPNAPGLDGLSSDIQAWQIRSNFIADSNAEALAFVELLENATMIYKIESFSVSVTDVEGSTRYFTEVIYYTYSILIP